MPTLPLSVIEKVLIGQLAVCPELGGVTELWDFLLPGKSSWLPTSVHKAK